METIKSLKLEDTHFFFEFEGQTIDVDSIKVILLWNGVDPHASLAEKYDQMRSLLGNLFEREMDLANTYLIFEKACAQVATLKKTFLKGQN